MRLTTAVVAGVTVVATSLLGVTLPAIAAHGGVLAGTSSSVSLSVPPVSPPPSLTTPLTTPTAVATPPQLTIKRAATNKPATKKPAPRKPAPRKPAAKKPAPTTPAPPPDPHDDPALIAAVAALQAAQGSLDSARTALVGLRAQVAAARKADAEARVGLHAAVLSVGKAQRDLIDVRRRVKSHRSDLGELARTAYRTNGPLNELALVLGSQTPEQMTDRLAFLQSIASAGNAVVSDLGDAQADLVSAQAKLVASRDEQQRIRTAAATALKEISVREKAASAAEAKVTADLAAQRGALAAALAAKDVDEARYRTLLGQSTLLGQRINGLGAGLSAGTGKASGSFTRPGTGELTSPFGQRYHPILHYVKLHTGQDLGVGDGFSYAADSGVVLLTEQNVAYGNMTVIDHGIIDGKHITTLYAHQARFAVGPGQKVRKGQVIGVIGATGYATGPHLHFEVRIDGQPVDPAPFLVNAPMPQSVTAAPAAKTP